MQIPQCCLSFAFVIHGFSYLQSIAVDIIKEITDVICHKFMGIKMWGTSMEKSLLCPCSLYKQTNKQTNL